jgi:hypothetical protein
MKLQPYELTFIAERLGRRSPAPLRWLELLASHPSALVREGVIYGLAPHVAVLRCRRVLEDIVKTDPDPEVRNAASEALET